MRSDPCASGWAERMHPATLDGQIGLPRALLELLRHGLRSAVGLLPQPHVAAGGLFGISCALAIALLLACVVGVEPGFMGGADASPRTLWIQATISPTSSMAGERTVVARIRDILKSYPEVVAVSSRYDGPGESTAAAQTVRSEFFVPLAPASAWPAGVDMANLTVEISARLANEFPQVAFNFTPRLDDEAPGFATLDRRPAQTTVGLGNTGRSQALTKVEPIGSDSVASSMRVSSSCGAPLAFGTGEQSAIPITIRVHGISPPAPGAACPSSRWGWRNPLAPNDLARAQADLG